jgi:hypothetical protein
MESRQEIECICLDSFDRCSITIFVITITTITTITITTITIITITRTTIITITITEATTERTARLVNNAIGSNGKPVNNATKSPASYSFPWNPTT